MFQNINADESDFTKITNRDCVRVSNLHISILVVLKVRVLILMAVNIFSFPYYPEIHTDNTKMFAEQNKQTIM